MAWGLPVVASSIAVEGLEFTNGSEILIAETDDAFAKSVIALSSEPERFERQRGLAYEKARFRFGPSAIEEAVRRGLGQTNAGDDIVMPFDDPSAARLFG
jgi:O-antigen biosynthesis protein